LLVWARLEAPKFKNTKAGRRAAAYVEDSVEGRADWNAQALKFEMWKYFDVQADTKQQDKDQESE
jgi:hypothetical protein